MGRRFRGARDGVWDRSVAVDTSMAGLFRSNATCGTVPGVVGRLETHEDDTLTGKQSGRGRGLRPERFMSCPGAAAGRECVPGCRYHTGDTGAHPAGRVPEARPGNR